MYTTIKEFTDDLKKESQFTYKLFTALTDDSLKQKVWENGRTLGFIAWHIILTLGEMGKKIGIENNAPAEDSSSPAQAAKIAGIYKEVTQKTIDFLEKNWTDEKLFEKTNLYGEEWENGITLHILIRHEIHHRGQLTVLMRQAGLKVPGIYGPSLEEWETYKMKPHK